MCEPGLQKQIEIYRGMTGSDRLQVGFELYDLARALVRSGVRFGHPSWSESQIQGEVNRRFRLAAGVPDLRDLCHQSES